MLFVTERGFLEKKRRKALRYIEALERGPHFAWRNEGTNDKPQAVECSWGSYPDPIPAPSLLSCLVYPRTLAGERCRCRGLELSSWNSSEQASMEKSTRSMIIAASRSTESAAIFVWNWQPCREARELPFFPVCMTGAEITSSGNMRRVLP